MNPVPSSLEEKWEILRELCLEGNRAIGLLADELFAIGGTKNILWADIDSRDDVAMKEWVSSDSFPFPKGSYEIVRSTTGKHHVWVSTDRVLEADECFSMYELIVDSIDDFDLAMNVDRVYGPRTQQVIYIPGSADGKPRLPQNIVASLPSVYSIPNLRRVPPKVWSESKKTTWEKIKNPLSKTTMKGVLERIIRMK
jgi:hypothetical protein